MAFYAPRGVLPEEIRRMPPRDRAILRIGRARWYEETRNLTAAGVAYAFTSEEDGNGR